VLELRQGSESAINLEATRRLNPSSYLFEGLLDRLIVNLDFVPIQGPNGAVGQGIESNLMTLVGLPPTAPSYWFTPRAAHQQRVNYLNTLLTYDVNALLTVDPHHGENPIEHVNIVGCVSQGNHPTNSTTGVVDEAGYYPRNGKVLFESHENTDLIRTSVNDVYFSGSNEYARVILPEMIPNCYSGGPYWMFNMSSPKHSRGPVKMAVYSNETSLLLHVANYVVSVSGSEYRHDLYFKRHFITYAYTSLDPQYDTVYDVSTVVNVVEYTQYYKYTGTFSDTSTSRMWTTARETAFDNLSVSLTAPYHWTGVDYSGVYYCPNTYAGDGHNYKAIQSLVGYDADLGRYVNNNDKSLRAFNLEVNSLLLDCYPCSFLSTRSGLDTQLSNLNLNQIEACQDLFGVMALVDAVRLLKAVRKLHGTGMRDLLLRMLDILTNGHLVYSFALAPSSDDIQRIVAEARKVRRRVNQFIRPGTFYGSDVVEDLETSGSFDGGLSLTVYSKIRFQAMPDALLTVLPLSAAGLLPELSSLWEVVPFSFIADRVFPINDLLESLDDTLILQAIDVEFCLHGYSVEYEFNDDELQELGCTSRRDLPSSWMKYRYYERMLSRAMPVVMPSQILASLVVPFTGGDLSVLGSLAYRLLRR